MIARAWLMLLRYYTLYYSTWCMKSTNVLFIIFCWHHWKKHCSTARAKQKKFCTWRAWKRQHHKFARGFNRIQLIYSVTGQFVELTSVLPFRKVIKVVLEQDSKYNEQGMVVLENLCTYSAGLKMQWCIVTRVYNHTALEFIACNLAKLRKCNKHSAKWVWEQTGICTLMPWFEKKNLTECRETLSSP